MGGNEETIVDDVCTNLDSRFDSSGSTDNPIFASDPSLHHLLVFFFFFLFFDDAAARSALRRGLRKGISKMYQWRNFEFFKIGGKCTIPDEMIGKRINCCASGRGKVVIGCDDGAVSLLDRGLKLNYGFQAHSSSMLFLQRLKQRNHLVIVGEDGQIAPPQSAACLKSF